MPDLLASPADLIAAVLSRGTGPLCVVAVIVIAYLARTAARTLADRLGVRLGPLLAFLVIVAAWLSLRLGRPDTPPGVPPPPRAAREARRLQELRRSNAEAERELDRIMWQGW